MTHLSEITRRKFLAGSAVAITGLMANGLPAMALGVNDQVVRLGLIGCGQRGGGIASILKGLNGVEITAFCDVDQDKLDNAKQYSKNRTAKYYKRHEQLLEDKNIDAVIIATPLFLHYPIAIDSLTAGKHVYVEKTMVYSIAEALALVEKVKNSKYLLQVGHQYRYYGLYHKVKEIMDQNWLGKVTHIESQYNRNSDWRRPVGPGKSERAVNWRLYREYSGGLMAELCAHQIDVVNWLLNGTPQKVIGMGGIDYWKDGREINDNVRTIYEYENGVKSSVTSISSNQFNSYDIRILGSKATVEIRRDTAFIYPEPIDKKLGIVDGVTGATVEAIKPGEGKKLAFESPDHLDKDPTAYALLAFAECIRNNKQPASNVYTGKDTAISVHLGNDAIDSGTLKLWKPEFSTKS